MCWALRSAGTIYHATFWWSAAACAIGRALVTRPALIMADEPTGNIDSKNSQEVIALLQSMSSKYQQTILMITHNENHAGAADRVFRMSDGVLKDLGVSVTVKSYLGLVP